MARRLIIIIAAVLTVTTHARAQYIDFFQSFSTFIQPQTTRRPDVTKRPTNKQTSKRYQDTIFFETNDFLKQKQNGRGIDPFTTTVKPKKIKTTRKPYQIERKSYENQINNYDINNDNNLYNYITQKPYFIAQMIPNRQTTVNPLLYRPGVRPAVVDDNRPPITNRPVTNRPNLGTNHPKPVDDGAVVEIGLDEDDMSETEKRRFIDIAEQKCEEYKSLSRKKLVALPLASIHSSPGVEVEVDTCAPNTAPLIIGGKVVTIQEFPHMGLLGWKNIQKSGYTWKCGGSLVSERYVLTAGHCTYHDKDYNVISGPPSAVQLGSSYLDGRDALVVSISTIIKHPKYKTRRSYYDVALVKLETTVKFSKSIKPACLGVPPPVGNRIITTGWGRTEFGGDSSLELRSVSIPIWEIDECRTVWGTSRKMPEGPSATSQLCAGEREGGKDTCQGDSGGPAQIQDGCSWRVVAVTSVGRSCGAKETPALYAKIPRAFIAAEIFSDVQLNDKQGDRYNGNNNQNNGNNNQGNPYNENNNQGNNNNRYNGNNNQGNNNNRYNGNSNQGTQGANRYNENNNQANRYNENNRNTDEVRRPGNHQTINDWSNRDSTTRPVNPTGNDWNNNGVRPGNHQTINRANQQSDYRPENQNDRNIYNQNSDEINRPGNHQSVDSSSVKYFATSHTGNRESDTRLGNHQMVNNRKEIPNYFVTSHASGDTGVSRTGNHQTIDKSTSDVNYFVTSHTNGESGISRPGNHQIVDQTNRGSSGTKYFVTSHTEDRETVGLPGNHQRLGNNNNREVSNQFTDSQHSESYQDVRDSNGNNQNNGYGVVSYGHNEPTYNDNRSQSSTQSYIEYRADTTVNNGNNNGYNGNNGNNNGYVVNNNRGFPVANRPWWNR